MNNEFERMQRQRRKGLRVMLFVLLVTAASVMGYLLLAARAADEPSGVGAGEPGLDDPSAQTSAPATRTLAPTTPSYPPLSTQDMVVLTVAWHDMDPSEQANICAFYAELPQDAIKQGVRLGFSRATVRAVLEFTRGELCPPEYALGG